MKKLITLSLILLTSIVARADDNLVAFESLPQNVKEFAKTTFPNHKVAAAKKETLLFGTIVDSYEVVFTDGSEIEFDGDGNWEEIKAKTSSVPTKLIPTPILDYVKENFKNLKVVAIDKDSDGYKITLSSNVELKFNPNFIFVGID